MLSLNKRDSRMCRIVIEFKTRAFKRISLITKKKTFTSFELEKFGQKIPKEGISKCYVMTLNVIVICIAIDFCLLHFRFL